jgi:hypothetical protein
LETTKTKKDSLVELEASLAPAEAEVGAVAKADQNHGAIHPTYLNTGDKVLSLQLNP